MQVLVVDDEEGIRENLRDLLLDAGYEVSVASDGVQAVELLHARPPGLVILDLMLPYLSGNAVYQIMQESPNLARIPVIITSSNPTASPPGLPVLAKPVDLDDLLEVVALCAKGLE